MRDEQATQANKSGHQGSGSGNRKALPLGWWLVSIVAALGIGAYGTGKFGARTDDVQPPLETIVKMGQLVSLKLNYAEIREFTAKRALDIPWSQWEIRMGGTTVVLVAKGDCSVATNLNDAKYEKVDAANRTFTISLPSPQAFQPRINHASRDQGGSYFYAITNRGVEALIPSSTNRIAAIDHALTWAQKDVERACSQRQVLASARENAETVLRATLAPTGWKPTFVWR
jgi:hypothetical protein